MLKPMWRDTNSSDTSDTSIPIPYSTTPVNNLNLIRRELQEYVKLKFKRLLLNSKFAIGKERENVTPYKIGATWIGKINQMAHNDYDRELDESRRTNIIKWDDSNSNKLRTGDYFGFIDARENTRVLNIYKIIRVLGPEYRRDEWSRNGYGCGQYDTHCRNCIILDDTIIQSVNWEEYIQNVGYRKRYLQGTMNIRDSSLFTNLY